MISLVAAAIASFWAGFFAGSLLLAICIFYRSHLLQHLTSFSQLCIFTFTWLVDHFQYSWVKPCDQTEQHGRLNYGYQIFSPLIKVPCDLQFLDDDEAFVSLEIIGSGGCGVVYTAQLPSCREKLIAVKKIHHLPPMGELNVDQVEGTKMLNWRLRQIRSEIKTAGQIRHRNLLPLLAHVARPNCHFLIYEFQKNRSLQHLLENVRSGSIELPWPDRQKIATGIAAGLEYLHMHNSSPIIHRDLKPANILISDEMEALITDFGLAKIAKEYLTSSRVVVGTIGYIAPEYYQTLKFTDKSDIYSFGVVLAAMITGMLPSDEFFQNTDEMCPVKWLRNVVSSENPYQAIDQKLLGGGYEDQILLALRIACFCTMDNPQKRPNSKEVLFMLSQIES